jgi:hypothetical protein
MRPSAALILLDLRCQKLEYKSQVASPRAGGAKAGSPGQAKRSPGLWRINKQALEGRQTFLLPFQGLSVCQPDPGLRFAYPGLFSFGVPGRLRKNLIWTRLIRNQSSICVTASGCPREMLRRINASPRRRRLQSFAQ